MPADDFGRRVTLETFRARVPAHDKAMAVKHIDRVIGDRIDKQMKAFRIALETDGSAGMDVIANVPGQR